MRGGKLDVRSAASRMCFLSSASGVKRRDEGLVAWWVLDGLGGRGEKLADSVEQSW